MPGDIGFLGRRRKRDRLNIVTKAGGNAFASVNRCCAILSAGRLDRYLPGTSSDLQTDIERRRVTLRILRRNDQQLAAAIAKKEIVGVVHRATSSRRVGFRRVDAIGERVVEV